MIKLLASLFAFLDKLLGAIHDRKLEEQGRQQATAQIKEAVDAEVAKTEAAVAVDDPVRDDRLRRRFDTAYTGPLAGPADRLQ